MSVLGLRILGYSEASFQKSGMTTFPTVREVAKAMRVTQERVREECDDVDGLMLTSFNTEKPERLGDHFVEVC